MATVPSDVDRFLQSRRIAVAGVSRDPRQAANAVFRKLTASGYETYAVNPNATEVEGVSCHPDLTSLPARVDGVVIATNPDAAATVVRQCDAAGVAQIWFHRSFGRGSVSREAVAECEARGITAIVGGCPLMFCEPVDVGHKCLRWWLQRRGRVPR